MPALARRCNINISMVQPIVKTIKRHNVLFHVSLGYGDRKLSIGLKSKTPTVYTSSVLL